MQKKVLAQITMIIEQLGFEVINKKEWANTGRLSIQKLNEFGELGKVRYDFQSDSIMLSIEINGQKLLSQPPRLNYYDFYFSYSDVAVFNRFVNTLKDGLSKLSTPVKNTKKSNLKKYKNIMT